MILYLNTSALVKMYVEEEGAPRVRNAVSDANSSARLKSHTLKCARHWRDAIATARSSGRRIDERYVTLGQTGRNYF